MMKPIKELLRDDLQKPEYYLAEMVNKKHGLNLTPKQAKSILTKRLNSMFNDCLVGKSYKANMVNIGVRKMKTEDVPAIRKRFWVVSDYQLSIMYTMMITFKEEFKGYFYFNPSQRVLKKLKESISSDPDFKLSYRNKVEIL